MGTSEAPSGPRTGADPTPAKPKPRIPARPKPAGPAPGRIIAAAASISAGIGLVALMGGAQQDVVVQVNPTPVAVQPANVTVEITPDPSTEAGSVAPAPEVRTIEAATPAKAPAPRAEVVTQSEGS